MKSSGRGSGSGRARLSPTGEGDGIYRVFVSYSTRDVGWASYLQQLLTDAGASVFVAEHDVPAGVSLTRTISAEVKACDLFILLWNRLSEASSYVQSEIFLAKSENKRILPLLLDRLTKLPPMLGDLKYLPLHRDPRSALAETKKLVADQGQQKAVSNLIAVALMAFIGWVLLEESN
jgi:hypothetical protein